MRRAKPILWLAIFLCCAATSRAETTEAPNCRNGIFVEEGVSYALAKIKGDGKANLLLDTAPCPSDAASCQSSSYVLPDDFVITGRSFGAYRCVFYRNRKNLAGSAGYVAESRLELVPAETFASKNWVGAWRLGDDRIDIRITRDGKLAAEGEAYWPSANPSPKEVPGGPHSGGMGGVAAPTGNQVAFIDDHKICEVNLTLLPPFLLARDNGSCGGANVYFRGVYMRAGAERNKPHR